MLRSLFWSFMEQGGTKIVTLTVQIVLARILDPEAFGVLAILLVLINLADTVAQSGLGTALVQKKNATDIDYSTAFWTSLGIATLLCGFFALFAPMIASFYGQPELALLLRVLSFVIILNAINSVQRSYLQRRMDFKGLFKANIVSVVVSGALGITTAWWLAAWELGVWALVVQAVSQSLCACIVLFAVVPWKPRLEFSSKIARELFSYGWKICATGILGVLYTGVSELVVGKACTVTDLGYYSQGRKWPNAAIAVVSNALQNVFFPVFASLQENEDAFRNAIKRTLVSGSLIAVPISLFFVTAAEATVGLLLTEKWLQCVPVFQMVCISGSFTLVQIVNLRAYMALGDSRLYLKLQAIKVLPGGAVICAAAILSRNVYIVAAVTMVTEMVFVILVDLWPAKRMFGYSRGRQLIDIFPIYFLSAIASTASFVVSLSIENYVFRLIIQAAVFLIIYVSGAKLFKLKGLADISKIVRSFARRF